MGAKIIKILIVVLLIAGILTLLYPFISNWYFTKKTNEEIQSHTIKYRGMTEEEVNEELTRAKEYNEALLSKQKNKLNISEKEQSILDKYFEILNIDGIMCVIEIPKIKTKLSVYHGVSDLVLKKGVGHMQETTLPIGGDGTHAYLTTHAGYPSAKLFSDLDELTTGDGFYIDVLSERLAYRVDKIDLVPAEEFTEIEIKETGDHITLVTCTPEGINSHRLLVRGSRVFDDEGLSIEADDDYSLQIWGLVLLITISIILWIIICKARKRCAKKGAVV